MARNDGQGDATNRGTPASGFSGSPSKPVDSFDFNGTAGGDTDIGGGPLAGATAGGSIPLTNEGRVIPLTDRLSSGFDATTNLLRDVDIDGIRMRIERQVREHPARTLMIAAGLGYLIGRVFRKDT